MRSWPGRSRIAILGEQKNRHAKVSAACPRVALCLGLFLPPFTGCARTRGTARGLRALAGPGSRGSAPGDCRARPGEVHRRHGSRGFRPPTRELHIARGRQFGRSALASGFRCDHASRGDRATGGPGLPPLRERGPIARAERYRAASWSRPRRPPCGDAPGVIEQGWGFKSSRARHLSDSPNGRVPSPDPFGAALAEPPRATGSSVVSPDLSVTRMWW